eukprot:m.58024 g.58024  ORF g.58024 m.58024 type:complete len:678 (-) comp12156_c0_seq1:239-2272(-)
MPGFEGLSGPLETLSTLDVNSLKTLVARGEEKFLKLVGAESGPISILATILFNDLESKLNVETEKDLKLKLKQLGERVKELETQLKHVNLVRRSPAPSKFSTTPVVKSQFSQGKEARVSPEDFAVCAALSHIGYIEALKILHPEALPVGAPIIQPRETAKKLAATLLQSRTDFRDRAHGKTSSVGGGMLNFARQGPNRTSSGSTRYDQRVVSADRVLEQHDTSIMASDFQHITSEDRFSRRVAWLHQAHDAVKHAIDITGAVVVRDSTMGLDLEPFVIIEVGEGDKSAQLFSYVYNVHVSDELFGKRNRLALGLELRLASTGYFSEIVLHGYRQAYDKDDKPDRGLPRARLTDVVLATISFGHGTASEAIILMLERIFECILQCAENNAWEGDGSPWCAPISQSVVSRLRVAARAGVHEAAPPAPGQAAAAAAATSPPNPPPSYRVFKAFSSTTLRRLEPSLQFLGAQIELQGVEIGKKTVTIISYPFIEGSHTAQNAGQLVVIARCVLDMHTAGWCHADIREANMVFTHPAAESRLIDFDFARNLSHEGANARYPPNWNPSIDDGKRHPDAKAEETMHFEHDLFALHAVLSLYQPVSGASATRTQWIEWIARLQPLGEVAEHPQPTTTLLQAFLAAVEASGVDLETLLLLRKGQPVTPSATAAHMDFGVDYTGSPP